MSKNITIQEDGVSKNFTAQKLKTNLNGGGTCLWVPEDEVPVAEKSITENGTYRAETDSLYGYSVINVNVAGGSGGAPGGPGSSVVGTDTDGNEYVVSVDENGELEKEKIPSRIEVTTDPTKTSYTDGETIDYSGIVITMYDAEGNVMGTVPYEDLIFTETTADKSKASDSGWTDGQGVNAKEYTVYTVNDDYTGTERTRTDSIGKTNQSAYPYDDVYMTTNVDGSVIIATQYNGEIYAISAAGVLGFYHIYKIPYRDSFYYYQSAGTLRIDNEFRSMGNGYADKELTLPISTSDPAGVSKDDMTEEAGKETLTIKWDRTGDSKELECSFDITISEESQT